MEPIIDMTPLFPYRFIYILATSFAVYNIIHSITKDKFHPAITFFSIVGIRVATSSLFFGKPPYDIWGYPVFSLILIFLVSFLTIGKPSHKFIGVIFQFLSYTFANAVASIFLTLRPSPELSAELYPTENSNLYHWDEYLTPVLSIVFISFLFSGILKLFSARHTSLHNKKLYAYLSFLPFSHLFILFLGFYIPSNITVSKPLEISFSIFLALILIFDCSFPFVTNYFERVEERNIQMEKEHLKMQLDYQQTAMLTEEKKEFRKIKHDFSNILTTVQGYIEIGKPEKALSVLQNTYTDLTGLAGFSVCSNETVNTILYMKTQQAKERGVTLTTEINEECRVQTNDYDLCRLLSNIMDNALNAAAFSDTDKTVFIRMDITENSIHIHSENGFKEQARKVQNTDAHGHGVGIIKDITKNYHGSYKAYTKENLYYTDTVFENRVAKKK